LGFGDVIDLWRIYIWVECVNAAVPPSQLLSAIGK